MHGCPVCGETRFVEILQRCGVPKLQNNQQPTRASARGVERGDLDVAACAACGFVTNRAFGGIDYPASYDNTVVSPAFAAHRNERVRHLVHERGIRRRHVVEVGCGQGEFLRHLTDAGNNTGCGYDPACRAPDSERLRFVRDYYRGDHGHAGAVISRHVIEHIPNPVPFLELLRTLNAAVFLETPDVEWILRRVEIWDVFYEHCSLFTIASLSAACELAGFRVTSGSRVFGDQYQWLEAEPARPRRNLSAGDVPELARRFAAEYYDRVAAWREQLERGTVALWGAGAKGVTAANTLDPDGQVIPCVVDRSTDKQGKFIPGTGHEIIAPAALPRFGVDTVLVMNPAYVGEVTDELRGLGLHEIAVLAPEPVAR